MSKEQGQLATFLKAFSKASGKKDQKLRMNLVDLTLVQPDFEELIQLLQTHLQDVEIFLDDQRILEKTQLLQFTEHYQAKTFLARGYWSEKAREQSGVAEPRLLIELNITPFIATVVSWKRLEKSAFTMQLKKLLLRRVTPIQNIAQAFIFCLFLSPIPTVMIRIFQQPFDSTPHVLQSLLEGIAGILAVPAFILLFLRLLLWMNLEARNLLLPGKATENRNYQQTALRMRVLIALVLLFLSNGFLIIGSSLLAHFWQ